MSSSNQNPGVGVIGLGTIFDHHYKAFTSIGARIAGVADVDGARVDRVKSDLRVPYGTTAWQELVDRNDIQVIDVCTPPKFHTEIVIAALEAGKHVICEKPLAPNLADVDRILEVSRRTGAILTVCHQLRFAPANQRLKWLVDTGHLGKICFARCVRYDAPPKHLVEKKAWGQWDIAGGGVLITKAIHQLDLLLWLLGKPKKVQAMMGTHLFSIESEDHVVANIEFESGALASLSVSSCPYRYAEHLDVVGDKGAAGVPWHCVLKVRNAEAMLSAELDRRYPLSKAAGAGRWTRLGRRIGRKLGMPAPQVKENDHARLFRQALSAFRGEVPNPVPPEDARAAIELCTAIYGAALRNESVDVPLRTISPYYQGIQGDDYRTVKIGT